MSFLEAKCKLKNHLCLMSYDFFFFFKKKNHNNIFMSVLYRFWYIGLYVVGLGKFKISQTKTPPFLFFPKLFFPEP